MRLKAPFPYFGGKSTVAHIVWQALGQPRRYIEPFFGSGAVLLARPNYDANVHDEIVNDKDGFIANIWRSLQFAPDEVARWCDWPVNHADLMARRKELIKNEARLLQGLVDDPKWFDAELAGYWIWAASCWIGSGLTRSNAIPHLTDSKGVHGQVPHLKDTGVHVKRPHLRGWFAALSERLRRVKVVCGEWHRVCGGNWQGSRGDVGIFFDPPYGVEDRATGIYAHDSTTVASDVMAWARERGKEKNYKIVLAGYEEHAPLLDEGWTAMPWKAQGGYANQGKNKGKNNRHREMLYFSPFCVDIKKQGSLFV